MMSRPVTAYLVLGAGGAMTVLAGPLLQALWPDWRGHHVPLHSSMEALSGLASIATAGVLFLRRESARDAKFQALGSGLLGMGLLDIFHAIAQPGNGFVLLRNMAGLVGAVGFALAWRSEHKPVGASPSWIPWIVATGAAAFGTWVLLSPGQIPEMVRNGEFTPTAVTPQSLASILFFVASWRLLAIHKRTGRPEVYLFAYLALLFAMAELVFMYSVPWDTRWWFWHGLRLTACLLMLGYLVQRYRHMVTDLETSLNLTKRTETTLRQNERRLKEALDERQRIAEDLHDGAIQSIYAVTLGIERCQRQLTADPQDSAQRLEAMTKDLKSVIRDLRAHLVGLEAPIRDEQQLEPALVSIASSMDNPNYTRFRVDVESVAAGQVNPEQSHHLLAIAREAMSNSVRHSGARNGRVSLMVYDGHVRLVVEDDGVGFQPAAVPPGGHGLKNMQARVAKLGGRLAIVSEAGQGTRIIVDLPQEGSHAST